MAYSTVRAPPKKNGKGGKFTWGADDDVTEYYLPVGPGGGYVAVATSSAGSQHPVAVAQPRAGFSSAVDSLGFPTLGTAALPAPVSWGPSRSTSRPDCPPESPPPKPERVQSVAPGYFDRQEDVLQSRQPLHRAAMAGTKDRHSRMAYSTVRAPPKKNGKGGKFTWGADDDVTEYYLPVGPGGGFGGAVDSSAFPPLGPAMLPASVCWGPSRR